MCKKIFTFILLTVLTSQIASANPGGVGTDLALWLKADGDVYNLGTTQATNG